MADSQDLSAGEFSSWLSETLVALKINSGTDVPCGECNACCRSSYFIHIKPDETETLACIPSELLFPAPGLPEGNVLMGFDEKGDCPMLKKGVCTIYEHRPLTCCSFDCRIFPATGIQITGKEKALIDSQVQRWKFDESRADTRPSKRALQDAATFLQHKANLFPEGELPGNPTQLAIMALKVYDLFLGDGKISVDDKTRVAEIIRAREKFESQD